jgi:nicotinamidase/pyrazinamidase
MSYAADHGLAVFASRDQHPAETTHFDSHGGPWPVHCVAGTPGAAFHDRLRLPGTVTLVNKGQALTADGYSAFEGQTAEGIPFGRELEARDVTHLYVAGLATDFCVKHSVLDARRMGLRVTVLTDCVAGVEREEGDCARALEEMKAAGAEMATAAQFIA